MGFACENAARKSVENATQVAGNFRSAWIFNGNEKAIRLAKDYHLKDLNFKQKCRQSWPKMPIDLDLQLLIVSKHCRFLEFLVQTASKQDEGIQRTHTDRHFSFPLVFLLHTFSFHSSSRCGPGTGLSNSKLCAHNKKRIKFVDAWRNALLSSHSLTLLLCLPLQLQDAVCGKINHMVLVSVALPGTGDWYLPLPFKCHVITKWILFLTWDSSEWGRMRERKSRREILVWSSSCLLMRNEASNSNAHCQLPFLDHFHFHFPFPSHFMKLHNHPKFLPF